MDTESCLSNHKVSITLFVLTNSFTVQEFIRFPLRIFLMTEWNICSFLTDASLKCSTDSSSNSLTTSSSGQSGSQTNESNIIDADQQFVTNSSETSFQKVSTTTTLVKTSAPKSDTKKSNTSPEICVTHNGTVKPQPTSVDVTL